MVAVRDTAGSKRRVIVDALLKAGADVNAKYDDDTPLSIALARRNQPLGRRRKRRRSRDRLRGQARREGREGRRRRARDGDGADEEKRAALLDALLAGTLDQQRDDSRGHARGRQRTTPPR